MSEEFRNAIDLVHQSLGNRAFRPVRALNAAVFDSVMVGTAKRLEQGSVSNFEEFKSAYGTLLNNKDFMDACGRGTAGAERVRKRLDLAQTTFHSVL